jgi:hypothetical protein
MQMDGEEKDSLCRTAREVSSETGFTRALAEKLIDKVYIYPGDRVEIAWKIRDFVGEALTEGGIEYVG